MDNIRPIKNCKKKVLRKAGSYGGKKIAFITEMISILRKAKMFLLFKMEESWKLEPSLPRNLSIIAIYRNKIKRKIALYLY